MKPRIRTHQRCAPTWLLIAALVIGVFVIGSLTGCGGPPAPTVGQPLASAAAPTPSVEASRSAPPSAPLAGSVQAVACSTATTGSLCLGDQKGTIVGVATTGTKLNLSIAVANPGGVTSGPIAVLLYEADAAALPFGPPVCTTCNSTASKSVIGLEWPALAAGETRTLGVQVPVTGATGTAAVFAALYARPLADVMGDEIANGIQPGQQSWKIALSIGAP